MQSLLCDIKPAESAGTKGVDGFYQEATIKEQAHKLSPALRAAERGASRVCSTDSASAGTKGNKHCSLIKNLCQNTGKADLATCGLSLVEVLVGAAIGAVVMLGTAKTLAVALQSSNIVRTIVTEQALKSSLTEALSGDDIGTKRDQNRENCAKNLAPNNLVGSHKDKGVGKIKDGLFKVLGDPDPPDPDDRPDGDPQDEKLISKGSFRDNIEVVEMELLDPNPTDSGPSDPKSAPDSGVYVQRRLIVRYKKNNLGQLNTVGNKECSNTDKSGCYFKMCDVDYGLKTTATANSLAEDVHTCHSYNCFQYGEWTASKKYCAIKNCLTNGCDQWSDKKPKESEMIYSYVPPFRGNLNASNGQGILQVQNFLSSYVGVPSSGDRVMRTHKGQSISNTQYMTVKVKSGGCCTIKKAYINHLLKQIKQNEREVLQVEADKKDKYDQPEALYRHRMICDSQFYQGIRALNGMLSSRISCSGVPKDLNDWFNFPNITQSQNSGDIGKKCLSGSTEVNWSIFQKIREPYNTRYIEDKLRPRYEGSTGDERTRLIELIDTNQYNWCYQKLNPNHPPTVTTIGINIPEWSRPNEFTLPTFSANENN